VILPLYQKMGVGLFEKISGIFAFALYDIENDEYLIARDPADFPMIVYLAVDGQHQFPVAAEEGLSARLGIDDRKPLVGENRPFAAVDARPVGSPGGGCFSTFSAPACAAHPISAGCQTVLRIHTFSVRLLSWNPPLE